MLQWYKCGAAYHKSQETSLNSALSRFKRLKFRMWFKYGLKAQKLIAQGNGHKQHALKGQKLLAQGVLGNSNRTVRKL